MEHIFFQSVFKFGYFIAVSYTFIIIHKRILQTATVGIVKANSGKYDDKFLGFCLKTAIERDSRKNLIVHYLSINSLGTCLKRMRGKIDHC